MATKVSIDYSTRIGIKEVATLLGIDNSFGPFLIRLLLLTESILEALLLESLVTVTDGTFLDLELRKNVQKSKQFFAG